MSVFLACAIGAGIGSLVALEIAHAFWWVGLFVGLATGYLTYEIKTVGRAMVSAWRTVFGWRPSPIFWKKLIFAFAAGFFFVCWWAIFAIYIDWIAAFGSYPGIARSLIDNLSFFNPLLGPFFALATCFGSLVLGLAILLMAMIFLILCVHSPFPGTDGGYLHELFGVRGVIYFSPPAIIFVWLPFGIWLLTQKIYAAVTKKTPAAIAAIGGLMAGIPRFVCRIVALLADYIWLVFLTIHSEIRLLCGVDAMLGAAIGYYAGSAVIGAIAGGLLGVINYALITERVLKPRGLV
jgi:hypothetical protein